MTGPHILILTMLALDGFISISDGQSATATIPTADGKCEITIDSSQSTELRDWADHKLAATLAEWYPKIVAMLPSPGFAPPTRVKVTIKPMDGVAYTVGTNIYASSGWLGKEINGEAAGALVHELVHVVQRFGSNAHNPGWLVEGSADYVRWFKYEPQSHGADIVWMRKRGKKIFTTLRRQLSHYGQFSGLGFGKV